MESTKNFGSLWPDVNLIKKCVPFLAKLNDDEARAVQNIMLSGTLSDEEKDDSMSILLDGESNSRYEDFRAKRSDEDYQKSLLVQFVSDDLKGPVERLIAVGNWKIIRTFLSTVWTPWIEFVVSNLEKIEKDCGASSHSNKIDFDLIQIENGISELTIADKTPNVARQDAIGCSSCNTSVDSADKERQVNLLHSMPNTSRETLAGEKESWNGLYRAMGSTGVQSFGSWSSANIPHVSRESTNLGISETKQETLEADLKRPSYSTIVNGKTTSTCEKRQFSPVVSSNSSHLNAASLPTPTPSPGSSKKAGFNVKPKESSYSVKPSSEIEKNTSDVTTNSKMSYAHNLNKASSSANCSGSGKHQRKAAPPDSYIPNTNSSRSSASQTQCETVLDMADRDADRDAGANTASANKVKDGCQRMNPQSNINEHSSTRAKSNISVPAKHSLLSLPSQAISPCLGSGHPCLFGTSKTSYVEFKAGVVSETPCTDVTFGYSPNNKRTPVTVPPPPGFQPIPSPRTQPSAREVSVFSQDQPDDNATNIILLGETGVGKTTFINALANYAVYDTFSAANRGGPVVLVKTQFSQTDGSYKNHEVVCEPTFNNPSMDTSMKDNEHLSPGESATQHPISYLFCSDSCSSQRIRIIDTPGIGDTRGSDADEKNLKNILQFLRGIPKLHAICILLSPNKCRLTTAFTHCLCELLKQLHVSAAKNILFCFTHSAQTHFEMGESLPTVRSLLETLKGGNATLELKNLNSFMFDNECYRFLCAGKCNVPLPNEAFSQCFNSWLKSSTEAKRLLFVASNLPAHRTLLTNKMHSAKAVLVALAQPLFSMFVGLTNNFMICSNELTKLQQCRNDRDSLAIFLREKQKRVRAFTEPCKPRTVCTSPKCSVIEICGISQSCHDDCQLLSVIGKVGAKDLKKCAVMNQGVCSKCGCSWSLHMQTSSKTSYEVVEMENPLIRMEMDRNCSIENDIQNILCELKVQTNELCKQREIILSACAKFTIFLENSSMDRSVDQFYNFLLGFTSEETRERGENNRLMWETVNDALKYYLREKDALKARQFTVNEIDSEIQSLLRLPFGEELKSLIEHSMTLDKAPAPRDVIVYVKGHLLP